MLAECVGIYVARNLVTGKVYVGSSVKVRARMRNHIRNLECNIHTNKYLQNAWNKYGKGMFVWKIVERCNRGSLRTREQKWIERLRANEGDFGYNQAYPVKGRMPSGRMTTVHKAYWSGLDAEKRATRLRHLTDPSRNPQINSRIMLNRMKDPAFKAKVLAGLTRARNKNNANPTEAQLAALAAARANAILRNKTPEGRAAQRLNNLAQWQDPVIRAARLASLAKGRQTQHERALRKRTASNDIV